MMKYVWSVAATLLLSVGVACAQSVVVFEDDFTPESITAWELFVPGDLPAEWEYVEEDHGFLRAPQAVENATAQTSLPVLVLGPTSDITKIIIEVDYRPHRYSANGYWKLYLLNKVTKEGYGTHIYGGIMDWKYQFIAINGDVTSTLKLTAGYQDDQSTDWITAKFVIQNSGSLEIYRNEVLVASGRIASGDLTGVPLGEFDQLVIVDRHDYAEYEFGRVKVSVEK